MTSPTQRRCEHAISLVVSNVTSALTVLWGHPPRLLRPDPVVSIQDNYDYLGYPADAAARSPRYARYVDSTHLLRTQMTSAIPPWLTQLDRTVDEDAIVVPGLVWRRDCVDRHHVGEPHQLDAWRAVRGPTMHRSDLLKMIAAVVEAILPGVEWRANETQHPYTEGGLEVEVMVGGCWLELLECGLICPNLLTRMGLDAREWSGLAMGIGLDRAVMVTKGLDDIRLLRSQEPRIAAQMRDLAPWRPVSLYPASSRDLSLVHEPGLDDETLGDLLREALGAKVDLIEEATIVGRWRADELPATACVRLGIVEGQENLLIRVLVRSADGPVSKQVCSQIYELAYQALHQGTTSGYLRAAS